MKKSIIITATALSLGLVAVPTTQVVLADTTVNNTVNNNVNNNSVNSSTANSVNMNSTNDNNGHAVQTQALSKPYVVYGAGLSANQQQEVGQVLGVQDNFTTLTATANDYREFINSNSSSTTNAEMISSVALEPTDPNSGVKVNIKNFDGNDNITQVTSQQYAMVATMAGVKDMNIIVTAPTPVSGTSALTGVYVALQKDGITLDSQNTAVANNMLNATQDAVNQNNNDPKYAGKLSNAVMNTAQQVAQNKQNDKSPMTQQQVQDALNKNLQKQGIADKTPQNTVNNITNIITNQFQKAPVADTKTFVDNAKNTVNNITNNIKNGADKAMFGMKEFKNNLPSENWFVAKWHAFCNWVKEIVGNNNNDNSNNSNNSNSSSQN